MTKLTTFASPTASKTFAGLAALATGMAAYADHITIASLPPNIGPVTPPGSGGPVAWDVNGDGVADFNFNYRHPNATGATGVVWQANMNPAIATGTAVVGYAGPFTSYASNLALFSRIGPALNPGASFRTASQVTLGSVYRSGGIPSPYGGFSTGSPNTGGTPALSFPQASAPTGFVGFRFGSGANQRYGWLRLNVLPNGGGIQFLQAAFDNTGGSILTGDNGTFPEPSSLAALALGAAAFIGRRGAPSSVASPV